MTPLKSEEPAKVSASDRKAWRQRMERYLEVREPLVMTLALMDGEVGPTKLDVEFLDWLRGLVDGWLHGHADGPAAETRAPAQPTRPCGRLDRVLDPHMRPGSYRGGMLGSWIDPSEIEERTPADRDRVVDLLRLAAVLLVVLGHWLVAVVLWRDGELVAGSALQFVPEARALTWVFQVMPLFFLVGGHVNGRSWARARHEGQPYAVWVRKRARRLLAPLVPVLALWVALPAIAVPFGFPARWAATAAMYALIPLWFLVVYLAVIGLVPVTWALHERFGLWVPAVAMLLVAVGDLLYAAEVPVVGFLNYLWVWGGVHQLGYAWDDRRLPTRPVVWTGIAAGAAAVTLALVWWAGYPGSMVAFPGAARHNTDPPSLALWTYAVMQIALVLAFRGRLGTCLQRPRVWAAVTVAGSVTLTLFLWHMTALVVTAGVLHLSGLWPRRAAIDATWWALRPVWLLACLVALVPLLVLFRRFEQQPEPVSRSGTVPAVLALTAFVLGMAIIAIQGVPVPGLGRHWSLAAVVLVAAGMAGLGALRPRSRLPATSTR